MSNKDAKPDVNNIMVFLDELKRQPWLGNRKWWPNYAFHFTDIRNAASVLNNGFLYSRLEATKKRLIVQDSASSQIIEHTDSGFTDYVRFYFRPLTPTAYTNEGFRPLCKLFHGAHCPVPLYLLFELKQLISFKPTRFSDGSLARKEHTILDSANDFMNLPFRDIYHNSGWGHEVVSRQDEIKNRRHAEIIYPKRISLDNLAFIVCRSQAEYETLHNILSPALWNRWKHIVAVSKHRRLFNNEWLFVKDVTLNPHSVRVSFNFPVHSRFYGPYSVRVDITDNITGKSGFFSQSYNDIVNALKEPRLDLDVSSFSSRNYTVRVTIDGILSYLGKYTGDDIPF